MKRWNYETHKYEPYEVPDDWYVSYYESDMDKEVNCAECGKTIKYGDTYCSTRIFSDNGLWGCAVCEGCHVSGITERLKRDDPR